MNAAMTTARSLCSSPNECEAQRAENSLSSSQTRATDSYIHFATSTKIPDLRYFPTTRPPSDTSPVPRSRVPTRVSVSFLPTRVFLYTTRRPEPRTSAWHSAQSMRPVGRFSTLSGRTTASGCAVHFSRQVANSQRTPTLVRASGNTTPGRLWYMWSV